jgi:hypothetical protein
LVADKQTAVSILRRGYHAGVLKPVTVALAILVLAGGCRRSEPPVSPPGVAATPAPVDSAALVDRDSAEGAANVVRAYYRAINERRYEQAYRLWASDGAASGKSLDGFRDGFGNTASVDVELEIPGRIEGAAGSRYVEIPVRITAVAKDGGRQVFSGSYTLRRTVVDGASAEQRAWRIYSAKVRRDA